MSHNRSPGLVQGLMTWAAGRCLCLIYLYFFLAQLSHLFYVLFFSGLVIWWPWGGGMTCGWMKALHLMLSTWEHTKLNQTGMWWGLSSRSLNSWMTDDGDSDWWSIDMLSGLSHDRKTLLCSVTCTGCLLSMPWPPLTRCPLKKRTSRNPHRSVSCLMPSHTAR